MAVPRPKLCLEPVSSVNTFMTAARTVGPLCPVQSCCQSRAKSFCIFFACLIQLIHSEARRFCRQIQFSEVQVQKLHGHVYIFRLVVHLGLQHRSINLPIFSNAAPELTLAPSVSYSSTFRLKQGGGRHPGDPGE